MIDELIKKHPLVSNQVGKGELSTLLCVLEKILNRSIPGDVAELGCYTGTTALFIQRLLVTRQEARQLHVYDSFDGLPAKTIEDESPVGVYFVKGELKASKTALISNFTKARLPLPVIHKNWFVNLIDADMPSRLAFAFLDGDFYDSITASLALTWPRLHPGGAIVVDDYQSEALPGVRRAVDQWLHTHTAQVQISASLAIIHKPATL